MTSKSNFKWYLFPDNMEDKEYRVFPEKIENDTNIFFHGTALEKLNNILLQGFIPQPPLGSVSYAKTSNGAICHAAKHKNGIIIAVRFADLKAPGLKIEISMAHTYLAPEKREEPVIIGVCKIPGEYKHQ